MTESSEFSTNYHQLTSPQGSVESDQRCPMRLKAPSNRSRRMKRYCCLTLAIVTVVVVVLVAIVALLAAGPLHAHCDVDWRLPESCDVVKTKLVDQFNKWSNNECGTGQKCKYDLSSTSDILLKGTHTTPKAGFVDSLKFSLEPITSEEDELLCAVSGSSRSNFPFAIKDSSTNYCNLRNLVEGAGLLMTNDAEEDTNNARCTQYSERNCEKF